MRVWVAILHVVGEDNDSTTSIVAKTGECLQDKLVEEVNSWFDGDDEYVPIASWDEWPHDKYRVNIDSHELED